MVGGPAARGQRPASPCRRLQPSCACCSAAPPCPPHVGRPRFLWKRKHQFQRPPKLLWPCLPLLPPGELRPRPAGPTPDLRPPSELSPQGTACCPPSPHLTPILEPLLPPLRHPRVSGTAIMRALPPQDGKQHTSSTCRPEGCSFQDNRCD